ncbi:MAG: hypothetical protein ABSB13_06675 [Candidatus Binatus sp.]
MDATTIDQLFMSACPKGRPVSTIGDLASIIAKERDLGEDKESVDMTTIESTRDMSSYARASELRLVDAIYIARNLTPDQIRDVTIRACPPPPPPALVKVEKLGTASNGCQVNILITNNTEVAWNGATIQIAFRDNSGAAIGDYRGYPDVYTEPGRGILIGNVAQGVNCKEIVAVSLLYLGYQLAPLGTGFVPVDISSIPTSIQ